MASVAPVAPVAPVAMSGDSVHATTAVGSAERLKEVSQCTTLVHDAVTTETADEALAFVKAIPAGMWRAFRNSSRGRKNRCDFGRSNQMVPPVLVRLMREAIDSAYIANEDIPHGFDLETVCIKTYSPGEGISKHKDEKKDHALVFGVTLCIDDIYDNRVMRFTPDAVAEPKKQLLSSHRSVHVFWGSAYTHAKHEQLKSKWRQRGRIVSFTARMKRRNSL